MQETRDRLRLHIGSHSTQNSRKCVLIMAGQQGFGADVCTVEAEITVSDLLCLSQSGYPVITVPSSSTKTEVEGQ